MTETLFGEHYNKRRTDPAAVSPSKEHSARCPNCKHKGYLRVEGSPIQTEDSTIRKRICLYCGFRFETEMKLERECATCGADDFEIVKTLNSNSGIHRTRRCKCCGRRTYTFEPLQVPEHLLAERRRRLSHEFFEQ